MSITATEFLALGAPRREVITVDGAKITVRELSVGERAQVLRCAKDDPAILSALLARLCILNPDGTQMFTEADADKLAAMRPEVVDPVARAVMRLSGMASEGDEKKD